MIRWDRASPPGNAGQVPKSNPTRPEKTTPIRATSMPTEAERGEIIEMNCAPPMPAAVPTLPPISVTSVDSVRNCARMVARRAPIARRTPISRVRSVTATSMMFMTPMPPTIRVIMPTAMATPNRVCVSSLKIFKSSD
jgi:hypothetical protein